MDEIDKVLQEMREWRWMPGCTPSAKMSEWADRIAAERANLYTMDQMRDYADSFHASREKMRGEAVAA